MVCTPEYEKKEQKILDIFQEMSYDQQFTMIGVLRAFAYNNRETQEEQEHTACTYRKSGKIVQFPAAMARWGRRKN